MQEEVLQKKKIYDQYFANKYKKRNIGTKRGNQHIHVRNCYIYDTYVEVDDDLQLNANINNVLVPKAHVSFNLMTFILDSSYLFYGSIFP